jgi:sorting nexin-13
MEYFWIVLSVCLALVSLGISGVFTLFFAIMAFISGCLCLIYGIAYSSKLSTMANTLTQRSRQFYETKRLRVSISESEEACYTSSGLSISGSPIIDAPLGEILGYVFRDYLYSWHFKLTHSKAFPIQLQDTAHFAITTLSRKIKDVDWMPFLTTR